MGSRALSDAPISPQRGRPTLILPLSLLGEPAGWMSRGHRAAVSCACPAAGCTKQAWGEVLFSAAASCCCSSPGWTRAHRTIPQHPGCLPAPDARSMSPFPLPFHEEFCRVLFTAAQESCVSHSLGAARPDPDQGLQMLLQ